MTAETWTAKGEARRLGRVLIKRGVRSTPQKRTFRAAVFMSALGQNLTYALQQEGLATRQYAALPAPRESS